MGGVVLGPTGGDSADGVPVPGSGLVPGAGAGLVPGAGAGLVPGDGGGLVPGDGGGVVVSGVVGCACVRVIGSVFGVSAISSGPSRTEPAAGGFDSCRQPAALARMNSPHPAVKIVRFILAVWSSSEARQARPRTRES
jgi:hypothetical protein